jgi:hypothetical protein
MLDEDFRLWLIEANTNPSLGSSMKVYLFLIIKVCGIKSTTLNDKSNVLNMFRYFFTQK